MIDSTIFSLRFGSNVKIEPSQDDLTRFLKSNKDGVKESQGQDLAPYWELLSAVADFKTNGARTFSDRMLYTVLIHSNFAKPALKAVVEQFKYHVHGLSKLDFKKPNAFIKSAEEEIERLSPKKKEEAVRIDRMRAMVEERKNIIDDQNKQWLVLAEELDHIISYITENLEKIEKLCEKSIAVLVNEQVDKKKETDLVEDIKSRYKIRLREALHEGTITKEQLETAREEVASLTRQTAELMLSDVYAMTRLYEKIHERAGAILRDLSVVNGTIAAKKHVNYEEDVALYQKLEKVLVSLVSDCRFEVKLTDQGPENRSDEILSEIRKEIIDHLVDLVQNKA